MSKGGYSFIAYPESAKIEDITQTLVGMGAAYAYILHDKDTNADGTPKKAHWHIVAGWEKSKPTWGVFKAACKSCGAVAVSPRDCSVQDFEGIENYLDHQDEPDKFQYSPETIVRSDDWEPDLYESADHARQKRRDAKKAKASGDVAQIIKIVREHSLSEFSEVCDFILEHSPDLFEALTVSGFTVKAYIDSARNSGVLRSKLAAEVEALTAENKRLADAYNELVQDARETGRERDFYKARLAAYLEAEGDQTPPLWDF